MLVSSVQPQNAYSPIAVKLSGRLISVRLLFANAEDWISVMPSGKTTFAIDVLPENASDLMTFSAEGSESVPPPRSSGGGGTAYKKQDNQENRNATDGLHGTNLLVQCG